MSTKARYIVGALLVTNLVLAPVPARALDDVLGWQGTTWAMTEPEVAKTMEAGGFRVVAVRTRFAAPFGHHVPFITNIDIDGNRYNVAFQFLDRSGRLSAVLIGAVADSRDQALMLYSSLLRMLSARYGSPGDTQSQGTLRSVARWIFKTTSIALHLDTDPTRGHRLTQVSVAFAPTAVPDQREAQDNILGLALLKLLSEGWRPQ